MHTGRPVATGKLAPEPSALPGRNRNGGPETLPDLMKENLSELRDLQLQDARQSSVFKWQTWLFLRGGIWVPLFLYCNFSNCLGF